MTTKRSYSNFLLVFFMLGCLLAPAAPIQAAPLGESDLAPVCAFGYTVLEIKAPSPIWVEIQPTGAKLAFPLADDSIVQVSNFGFSFPYFENSYSNFKVSTNGYISFGSSNSMSYGANFGIPTEVEPNNLIAGFWDDLTVGENYKDGAVYYEVQGTFPNRSVVIEWYRVTRKGMTDLLSFEIVLSENGDVTLNYDSLNGAVDQATAGIEDSAGVDGCQLVYNSKNLFSNRSYKLSYPAPGPRVKATPLYQGQFLENGLADLPFTLTNTGTAPDSFHFSQALLSGASNWQVQVVDAQKAALTNTPVLAPKQTYSAFIRVRSPSSAGMGAYIKEQLAIVSDKNEDKTFSIYFHAAIPAPFAAFYVDSSAAFIRYSMPQHQVTTPVFPSFTGSTFTLERINDATYFTTWEYVHQVSGSNFGNIQKAITGPTSGISPLTNLVDNASQPYSTIDANPMIAVAPDGTVGMVFVRKLTDELVNRNANVYFARLDKNGILLPPFINLTNNNAYYSSAIYTRPVIAATLNNRFVIAFESKSPVSGLTVAKDIDLAVVSSNGTVVDAPHHITDSVTSGTNFSAPVVTQMKYGNVFLTYLSQPSGDPPPPNQMKYSVYNQGTGSLSAAAFLSVEGASNPEVETLMKSGAILLSWINADSLSVGYMIFNPDGQLLQAQPWQLISANGWKIENISVTGEVNGNAVITWKDEFGYFLYYALVGPDGSLITQPMAFLRGSNPVTPNVINSSTGRGTAPLANIIYWGKYLPVVRK